MSNDSFLNKVKLCLSNYDCKFEEFDIKTIAVFANNTYQFQRIIEAVKSVSTHIEVYSDFIIVRE